MKRHSKKLPQDDPAQSKRFVETAKAVEAQSGEAFTRAFKIIVPRKRKIKKVVS